MKEIPMKKKDMDSEAMKLPPSKIDLEVIMFLRENYEECQKEEKVATDDIFQCCASMFAVTRNEMGRLVRYAFPKVQYIPADGKRFYHCLRVRPQRSVGVQCCFHFQDRRDSSSQTKGQSGRHRAVQTETMPPLVRPVGRAKMTQTPTHKAQDTSSQTPVPKLSDLPCQTTYGLGTEENSSQTATVATNDSSTLTTQMEFKSEYTQSEVTAVKGRLGPTTVVSICAVSCQTVPPVLKTISSQSPCIGAIHHRATQTSSLSNDMVNGNASNNAKKGLQEDWEKLEAKVRRIRQKSLTIEKIDLAQLPQSLYLRPSTVTWDEYHEIAAGSYGRVFQGYFLDHSVCVKTFKYGDKDMFKEATVLLNLKASHHLPYLFGVIMTDDCQSIVTSFHGRAGVPTTMAHVLKYRHRFEYEYDDWLHIVDDLLNGLRAIHASKFLHNDIKTCNIIIEEPRHPVIIDFNTACSFKDARSVSQALPKKRPEEHPWIDPAVCNRMEHLSEKSDIYGVGYCIQCISKRMRDQFSFNEDSFFQKLRSMCGEQKRSIDALQETIGLTEVQREKTAIVYDEELDFLPQRSRRKKKIQKINLSRSKSVGDLKAELGLHGSPTQTPDVFHTPPLIQSLDFQRRQGTTSLAQAVKAKLRVAFKDDETQKQKRPQERSKDTSSIPRRKANKTKMKRWKSEITLSQEDEDISDDIGADNSDRSRYIPSNQPIDDSQVEEHQSLRSKIASFFKHENKNEKGSRKAKVKSATRSNAEIQTRPQSSIVPSIQPEDVKVYPRKQTIQRKPRPQSVGDDSILVAHNNMIDASSTNSGRMEEVQELVTNTNVCDNVLQQDSLYESAQTFDEVPSHSPPEIKSNIQESVQNYQYPTAFLDLPSNYKLEEKEEPGYTYPTAFMNLPETDILDTDISQDNKEAPVELQTSPSATKLDEGLSNIPSEKEKSEVSLPGSGGKTVKTNLPSKSKQNNAAKTQQQKNVVGVKDKLRPISDKKEGNKAQGDGSLHQHMANVRQRFQQSQLQTRPEIPDACRLSLRDLKGNRGKSRSVSAISINHSHLERKARDSRSSVSPSRGSRSHHTSAVNLGSKEEPASVPCGQDSMSNLSTKQNMRKSKPPTKSSTEKKKLSKSSSTISLDMEQFNPGLQNSDKKATAIPPKQAVNKGAKGIGVADVRKYPKPQTLKKTVSEPCLDEQMSANKMYYPLAKNKQPNKLDAKVGEIGNTVDSPKNSLSNVEPGSRESRSSSIDNVSLQDSGISTGSEQEAATNITTSTKSLHRHFYGDYKQSQLLQSETNDTPDSIGISQSVPGQVEEERHISTFKQQIGNQEVNVSGMQKQVNQEDFPIDTITDKVKDAAGNFTSNERPEQVEEKMFTFDEKDIQSQMSTSRESTPVLHISEESESPSPGFKGPKQKQRSISKKLGKFQEASNQSEASLAPIKQRSQPFPNPILQRISQLEQKRAIPKVKQRARSDPSPVTITHVLNNSSLKKPDVILETVDEHLTQSSQDLVLSTESQELNESLHIEETSCLSLNQKTTLSSSKSLPISFSNLAIKNGDQQSGVEVGKVDKLAVSKTAEIERIASNQTSGSQSNTYQGDNQMDQSMEKMQEQMVSETVEENTNSEATTNIGDNLAATSQAGVERMTVEATFEAAYAGTTMAKEATPIVEADIMTQSEAAPRLVDFKGEATKEQLQPTSEAHLGGPSEQPNAQPANRNRKGEYTPKMRPRNKNTQALKKPWWSK